MRGVGVSYGGHRARQKRAELVLLDLCAGLRLGVGVAIGEFRLGLGIGLGLGLVLVVSAPPWPSSGGQKGSQRR